MGYNLEYTFRFRDVFSYQDLLLEGALLTLQLTGLAIIFGVIIGVLGAAIKNSQFWQLRWIVGVYVEVIRNTPLLVQLFILFFGLPSIGIKLGAITAATIALSINLGAYLIEIIRAGIEAIAKSQVEAGLCLGMSRYQLFRYVILFPALKMIYPAATSQFVLLLVASSVCSLVGAVDLFHAAAFIESRTFRSLEAYLVITVLYLLMALFFRTAFAVVYHFVFVQRYGTGR